jgi:hypothetical protein
VYFPISEWFPAFLLTLAVEAPIVLLLVRRAEPDLFRLAVIVLFANLATHLAVWYVITQLLLVGSWQYLVVAESWAVAAEAIVYWAALRGLRLTSAAVVATVANLASFAAGRALAALWPHVFG